MATIKSVLYRNFTNIIGKKTTRKIVVFESDDWGSIRMPSRKVYDYLLKEGVRVDKGIYSKNDSLESAADLMNLFDVLMRYSDKNSNHPVITANAVMANPDFDKIKSDDFSIYHYELFFDTYERYYSGKKQMLELWDNGIKEHIFIPQFHGREHYRVDNWMSSLYEKNEQELKFFDLGIVGQISKESGKGSNYLIVLKAKTEKDIEKDNDKLVEGLNLFEQMFKFRSKTFIAPCYTWSPLHEEALYKMGVSHIQGLSLQQVPYARPKFHYMGMKNRLGQKYLVRNAFFEPVSDINAVENCLQRISNAFLWHTPAIVSVHRVNFCGEIFENNRTENLRKLDRLLSEIVKRWPDVEFMSSDQLADII